MIKYNLEIYPRVLYVELLSRESIAKIVKNFYTVNGDSIDESEFDNYSAGVVRVISKKTKELGYIAIFRPESINIEDITHESFHVADAIGEDVGLEYFPNSGNEHFSYLAGYIAKLIQRGLNKLIETDE